MSIAMDNDGTNRNDDAHGNDNGYDDDNDIAATADDNGDGVPDFFGCNNISVAADTLLPAGWDYFVRRALADPATLLAAFRFGCNRALLARPAFPYDLAPSPPRPCAGSCTPRAAVSRRLSAPLGAVDATRRHDHAQRPQRLR